MFISIYIYIFFIFIFFLKLYAAAYSMFLHPYQSPSIQWLPDPLWTASFQRKRWASNSLMQEIPWPFQNKNLKYKKKLGLHHITVRGKRLKVHSLTMKRYNLLSIWNVSKQLSYIYQKSLISSKKHSRLCLCFVILFQLDFKLCFGLFIFMLPFFFKEVNNQSSPTFPPIQTVLRKQHVLLSFYVHYCAKVFCFQSAIL